ncbi:MAG: CRISPR system precrRNA processing endoribonuclease RAMP protein Cas6 [Candidatus Jettenia sp.]|nr:CRISPR system precrRNA processing endoribonuclease RAMP protein Cas6 [Candidatus Jettenia sp.]
MTKELEFHVLFRSILRRLSTLLYFHCNEVKLSIDYKQLIEDAKGITVAKNDLIWDDYERYSTRKEQRMKIGGFSGSIRYCGDLEPFISFLLLAEYIHTRKSVSFGFGQIALC